MRDRGTTLLAVAVLLVLTAVSSVPSAAADGPFPEPSTPQAGVVEIDEDWTRVDFPAPVRGAVVVVGPATSRGREPVVPRVRSVTRDGFEVRLEEWPHLDGEHTEEDVAWLAVSRGVTTLPSGARLQAGKHPLSPTARRVDLHAPSAGTPIVLSTPLDGDLSRPVTVRVDDVDDDGFDLLVQAQEAGPTGEARQDAGWVALTDATAGDGANDPFSWATARQQVTDAATTVDVPGAPSDACVLGGQQTTRGSDPAALRVAGPSLGPGPVAVQVQEDQSRDDETDHVGEDVALLLVGCGDASPPPPPPPPRDGQVDHVVQVSIDGLRPDAISEIGAARLPNLTRVVAEGASTMNARSDPDVTRTLPNHTSQLTGRHVAGAQGHGVARNEDEAVVSVHAAAGRYVHSVLDVVHDHGGRTGLFAGKSKFNVLDRSYDATRGATDTTGADDGRDKLDRYLKADVTSLLAAWRDDMARDPHTFSVVHLRSPDEAGHDHGWMGPEYLAAVRAADAGLGEVLATIEGDPRLAGRTAVLVTSDHGGNVDFHGEPDLAVNYTTPFVVWAPGVATAGSDLYALNPERLADPGGGRPPRTASPPPLWGHNAGNLALDLLGLPPIPGSTINVAQDLALR